MKRLIHIVTLLAFTAVFLAVTPIRTAHAQTRIVNNTNDSGAGSLRQAILDAIDGDVIDATGISGTLTLLSELYIDNNLTINGPGASNLTVSGNNAVRVFYIAGKSVTINDLTVANGRVVDNHGAGIFNWGSLTLNRVTVTNNAVVKSTSDYNRGGGIYSHDGTSLTITDSTISGNTAQQNGGGIHVSFNAAISLTNVVIDNNSLSYTGSSGGGLSIRSGSTATLTDVSITDNSAQDEGGGVYTDASLTISDSLIAGNTVGPDGSDGGGLTLSGTGTTFNLTNVTISGNSVVDTADTGYGGGLDLQGGTLTLNNTTITNNTSEGYGGGLVISLPGTASIGNSILGGNNATNSASKDCYGTLNSLDHNLITNTTGCTITGTTSGNITGEGPLLNPLANNGGPSMTHSLKLNSPALDTADNTTCESTDQRGVARPQNGDCDMGAYELKRGKLTVRSISTQDGWVLENSENGNAGGSMDNTAIPLRLGDDAARKQYRSILSFNTALLPDNAVITRITLKLRKHSITGGGNPLTTFQGFMTDVRKGTFGSAALQVTDWQAVANKTLGPFTPALISGWYTLDLTTAKLQINKLATLSGLTQIRLRFQLDDDNNATANYLSIYSGNAALASRPQLIVEYYVP